MAHRCTKCGAPIIDTEVLYNGKIFCIRCTNMFGTCAMCQNGVKCEFQTNSAPIPQVITKRIQHKTERGIMEQITQAPNPQRIKAFCMEGNCICCKTCEDEKVRCMRQFGTCENYKEIEF